MSSKIQVEQITVSPKKAASWLEAAINGLGQRNRALSARLVERFSREMASGRWELNGSTIVFDNDGLLIDGQHRLTACVQSNVSFKTLAAFNVPAENFHSIDTGKCRSAGDLLSIRGVKYYRHVATAARHIWRWGRGQFWDSTAPSNLEVEAVVDEHPGLIESARYCMDIVNPVYVVGASAALHYLCAQKDATLADWFFDALGRGEQLKSTDPVYQLREILLTDKTSKRRLSPKERMALVVKAWNLTRQNRTVRTLRFITMGPNAEKWPTIQ